MKLKDNDNVAWLSEYAIRFYDHDFHYHHTNGPSIITLNGTKQYHENDRRHNLRGKALIGYGHKEEESYRIKGKKVSKRKWQNATRG